MPIEITALDILGVKPVGEALRDTTSAGVKGAGEFLGRICLPVAEEMGLFMRDRVRGWRLGNLGRTLNKAEAILTATNRGGSPTAPPHFVVRLLEEASWAEDDGVQGLWAGLLASACSETGDDEGNLSYLVKLRDVTPIQAKLLCYACVNSPKSVSPSGLIVADEFDVPTSTAYAVVGYTDIHRLDADLDHLRSLELLAGGFDAGGDGTAVSLTPTALALNLFVRVSGSRESPPAFFKITRPTEMEPY